MEVHELTEEEREQMANELFMRLLRHFVPLNDS